MVIYPVHSAIQRLNNLDLMVLFKVMVDNVLEPVNEISVTIKLIQQFSLMLFIILHKVVPSFYSVDQIFNCDLAGKQVLPWGILGRPPGRP